MVTFLRAVAQRAERFRVALRSARGAIDLASVMVGVLVIGVVGAVIAATLFMVIPWAQDEAAKASLGSVRTSESVMYASTSAEGAPRYGDLGELQSRGLLPQRSDTSLSVLADDAGSCFVGVAQSASGRSFYVTDTALTPAELTDALAIGCDVDLSSLLLAQPSLDWEVRSSLPFPVHTVAISGDGSRVAAGNTHTSYATRGVWLSDDHGQSWAQHLSNIAVSTASLSHDGSVIAVGSNSNGHRPWAISLNGGEEWEVAPSNQNGSYFTREVVTNATGSIVLKSRNGAVSNWTDDVGATWRGTYADGDNFYTAQATFHGVAVSNDGSKIALFGHETSAGNAQRALLSINGGLSFHPFTYPRPEGSVLWITVAASADLSSVVLSSRGTLYVTHDFQGTSTVWSEVSAVTGARSVAMSDDGKTIMVTTADGLHVSLDGGSSWKLDEGLPVSEWRYMAVSADGRTVVLAVRDATEIYIGRR